MPKDTVTDIGTAINQIAEANIQIRDKDATISALSSTLEKLQADITTLETNKKNLEAENNKIFGENSSGRKRFEERERDSMDHMTGEREKFEQEKQEIQKERETIQTEREALEATKNDIERLKIDIENERATLLALETESKRLSSGRALELEALEKEKEGIIQEGKKTKITKNQIEKEAEENRLILERIKEAQAGAEETFANIQKERQENERLKTIAQSEVASADFIKNEAYRLVMVFRQALHTFVQVNGTTVRIVDLTDEDMKFVARDILEQVAEVKLTDIFEKEKLDTLVVQYIESEEQNATNEVEVEKETVTTEKVPNEVDADIATLVDMGSEVVV